MVSVKAVTQCLLQGLKQKAMGLFSKKVLPSFFIVGAQKAGTTSLFEYLSNHPDVIKPRTKESSFFVNDVFYHKGIKGYEKFLPSIPFYKKSSTLKTYDATPEYLYYPAVAERIKKYFPTAKIIILLRDPVDRAYSAWNMFKGINENAAQYVYEQNIQYANADIKSTMRELIFNKPYPDFLTMIEKEMAGYKSGNTCLEPSFVRRGIYIDQIRRYLNIFGHEQVLILESEHLKKNTEDCIRRVEHFLDIQENNWRKSDFKPAHVQEYSEKMSREAEKLLSDFYKPFNEELFTLLGVRYNWK